MGDRANVLVKENKNDNGVCLYTHWGGTELPLMLQEALAKHWRWDDPPYLTRIIFDVMTRKYRDKETGYGISTQIYDGENRVLEVNCKDMTVSFKNKSWTFEQYTLLSKDEVYKVWY